MAEDRTGNIEVWSVEDIIRNYSSLGIPHFQRGSVWSDENIAALLESLYYDTPCGSFVLWPNDDENNGTPLKEGAKFRNLVIDGQQRIRSLYSVFTEAEAAPSGAPEAGDADPSPEEEDGGDSSTPYVWAINLYEAAGRDLRKKLRFKTKNQPRYRNLFAKIQDPEKRAAEARKRQEKRATQKTAFNGEYPYQYDFFPLKYIDREVKEASICFKSTTSAPEESAPQIYVDITGDGTEEERKALWDFIDGIRKRLKTLRESGRFTVYGLKKDASLEDVVHTFIRINSGGRPVQSEEKAFSRLVQLCPAFPDGMGGTANSIRDLFSWVQGRDAQTEGNDFLQRMQERQFGFRLFIRVFILAVNYHLGRAVGTTGLSFSVIQGEAGQLENKKEKIQELWDMTADAVVAVRKLLRDRLCFDTLAFLPDSRSLLPIFMLLIKYPAFMAGKGEDCKIREVYQLHFAYILLTVLLTTGDSEGEIMKLTTLLREVPQTGEKVLGFLVNQGGFEYPAEFEGFPAVEKCGKLKVLWDGIVKKAKENEISERLKSANSLTSRYVLLLYALERHLGACDFYGKSLPGADDRETCSEEHEKVGAACCPEKQHIVPYSAFNLQKEGRGRVVNSPANNIGNITYISQYQNREVLGSLWLQLHHLEEKLRLGHVISEKAISEWRHLDDARAKANGEGKSFSLSSDDEDYRAWIEQRRNDIATAFVKWLRDMKTLANLRHQAAEPDIRHAPAVLVDETGKAADHAFLPRLWETECEAGLKRYVSWLSWKTGSALSRGKSGHRILHLQVGSRKKKDFRTKRIDLTEKATAEIIGEIREFFDGDPQGSNSNGGAE